MPSLLRDGLQPSSLLSLTVRVFRPFGKKLLVGEDRVKRTRSTERLRPLFLRRPTQRALTALMSVLTTSSSRRTRTGTERFAQRIASLPPRAKRVPYLQASAHLHTPLCAWTWH